MCLSVAFSSCVYPSSSYEDIGRTALGPTGPQAALTLTNHICTDPVPKSGHLQRYWGLGLQHILFSVFFFN